MYRPRHLADRIREALRQFPAVLVTGPRQSGKTTLLLEEFGGGADYVSFDDPFERSFARDDPNGFLDRFEGRAILDEIQYVPELLQYLKLRIDRQRDTSGRWILTGSQQFELMANVGETLAGRIAVLELPPFSLLEVGPDERGGLEGVIWNGGYPDPTLHSEMRDPWVSSYIRTYLERDVRSLTNVRDLAAFERFLALSAARHGQELNMAAIGRDVGVTVPTVRSWIGVLTASYVALSVPPFFANLGKRVVRSPRFYLLDSAIACALTRQPSSEAALAGAMGGALFEGLVVTEVFKILAARGRRGGLWSWRSHDGLEVDLLVELGDRLLPLEIKLTATPKPAHLRPLEKFQRLAKDRGVTTGVLVCRVPKIQPLPNGHLAVPWTAFPRWLRDRI